VTAIPEGPSAQEDTAGQPEPLAQTLARETQIDPRKAPSASPAEALDLARAMAAWGALAEADRRDKLDALAAALRPLPLTERVRFAAKLLDNTAGA
jgi:hypothetical protein